MGSPLGPILADIFVGFHEKVLFSQPQHDPSTYIRYVDDTFAAFASYTEALTFFNRLNSLHSSLKFTMETEKDGCLPFLDVLVERCKSGFLTSIYRKPTFTGLYTKWSAFCPKSRKVALIHTLVHRALCICSPSKLAAELETIRDILIDNGYPLDIIDKHIGAKVLNFRKDKTFGPHKCPVYLKLPWYGGTYEKMYDQISESINNCYPALKTRLIFCTKSAFPSFQKDSLPHTKTSNIIYKFKCQCEADYVGRTSLHFETRINQHVPEGIRKGTFRLLRPTKSNLDSAIGQHLLANATCAQNYTLESFSILFRARSDNHLKFLESVAIAQLQPTLCHQKRFARSLFLFGEKI